MGKLNVDSVFELERLHGRRLREAEGRTDAPEPRHEEQQQARRRREIEESDRRNETKNHEKDNECHLQCSSLIALSLLKRVLNVSRIEIIEHTGAWRRLNKAHRGRLGSWRKLRLLQSHGRRRLLAAEPN